MVDVPGDGHLVAHCAALGSDEPREEGGGNKRQSDRATDTHSPHFQRRPTVSLQHFLSSSGNKTSGAGLVPHSGIDYQLISQDLICCLFSPGRHFTHIALRI